MNSKDMWSWNKIFLVSALMSIPAIAGAAGYVLQTDGNYRDPYTGFKTFTSDVPTDKDVTPAKAIENAKAFMRTGHCAMKAVVAFIDREHIKITFGDSPNDPNGYYDPTSRSIVVNQKAKYLLNTENLAKLVYKLGLFAVDQAYGVSQKQGTSPADPKNAPLVLKTLLGENSSCLKNGVGADGALLSGGVSFSATMEMDANGHPKNYAPSTAKKQLTLQDLEDTERQYPGILRNGNVPNLSHVSVGKTLAPSAPKFDGTNN